MGLQATSQSASVPNWLRNQKEKGALKQIKTYTELHVQNNRYRTFDPSIHSMPAASESSVAFSSAPPKRIRRKGTTLRKVNKDRNALRTLHIMFTAKLALYGKTYPINSRNRFKSMVLQSIHQLGR